MLMKLFETRLIERKERGNLRTLSHPDVQLLDFSSLDYLGIARSTRFQDLFLQEFENLKQWGSTGSRLLTGNSSIIEQVEEEISYFHGFEEGLLFHSGFIANCGLLSVLSRESTTVIYDSYIHASIHAGIRLGDGEAYPFRHNDLNHLEWRLQKRSHLGTCFICIESIYSTDGSIAPLKEICNLAEKYGAHIILDEAHSTGLYGKEGRGLSTQEGLDGRLFAKVVTFGKVLGVQGAIVLGSSQLKQLLINFAAPFIYTTAPTPILLAAIRTSYRLFPSMHEERAQLRERVRLFHEGLNTSSKSQVQPIFIRGNQEVQRAQERLQKEGFDVRALKSPTVPQGGECLRITLHSFNDREDTLRLINCIQKVL